MSVNCSDRLNLKFCKGAIVMTKTNIKCMTTAKEKQLKMYTKILKYLDSWKTPEIQILTPEESSKTTEMELVYSW